MNLGIIDMGSNTMRLVIWQIADKGYYRILDEIKESVRLGANDENPRISQEKIEQTIATLKKFKNFAKNLKVGRLIVVATEAVRRAPNQEDFLKTIHEETGLVPIVLGSYEEAYLDYRGVTGSMEVENSLMVDIGGSSTELVWIKNNELMANDHLPIGTLTLKERFHLENIITQEDHVNMEALLKEAFGQFDWIKDNEFKTMILVGGSARTIGRMDYYRKRYPIGLTHNYMLYDLDIHEMYRQMMIRDAHNRAKIPGLMEDRADIILGALGIVNSLCELSGLSEIRISGNGMREGILYEHILANEAITTPMLDFSLLSILNRHNMEPDHPQHVYKLAGQLYRCLAERDRFPQDGGAILKAAAILHDVGLSIRHYDHENHSFYIILNSGLLGLNHREILLAAMAARYHRRIEDDLSLAAYSQLINRMDLIFAEKLGLLVAIAEAFERNLSGFVTSLAPRLDGNQLILSPTATEDITTEIQEAQKIARKFKELFHLDLILPPINN